MINDIIFIDIVILIWIKYLHTILIDNLCFPTNIKKIFFLFFFSLLFLFLSPNTFIQNFWIVEVKKMYQA